jgi:DNA mismatch repair protein MSH2
MFELVAGYYPVMEQLSVQLSELDVLTTFASVVLTANQQWSRPKIGGNGVVGVQMRHPCLKNCVPNDCDLSTDRTIILTGPNMGGKSTYIRTIGICTYLSHLGAYVPAAEFSTPIVDAIITRVGASDLQIKGISTFMSEMLESSCMLKTATCNSLVLIDELGRGTSTCEGFGVAWAICEYLHCTIGPQCLFATHFHEMTQLASDTKGVKNMFTRCRVDQG